MIFHEYISRSSKDIIFHILTSTSEQGEPRNVSETNEKAHPNEPNDPDEPQKPGEQVNKANQVKYVN